MFGDDGHGEEVVAYSVGDVVGAFAGDVLDVGGSALVVDVCEAASCAALLVLVEAGVDAPGGPAGPTAFQAVLHEGINVFATVGMQAFDVDFEGLTTVFSSGLEAFQDES